MDVVGQCRIDDEAVAPGASALEFSTDAALNIVDVSEPLADLLARSPDDCVGQPLTALFRLVEEDDGRMPLLAALATRSAVEGQRALVRGGNGAEERIDARPMLDESGQFAGFQGLLRGTDEEDRAVGAAGSAFEKSLDEALRSPLARIISAADRIVERSDGPLRSDYANYASDIAAAGRHLLSVIRSMGEGADTAAQLVDIGDLAAEAVALVQPLADDRAILLELASRAPLMAKGEARAVVQVLVNILGNAVRHSPDGATVAIAFDSDSGHCRISVTDQGPGIAPDDQQRIFERYERVGDAPDGSGLGLAISRRLARTMGGDVTLESAPGQGARFTLILPAA